MTGSYFIFSTSVYRKLFFCKLKYDIHHPPATPPPPTEMHRFRLLNDYSINSIVKKIPAVKWSQSNKCWYVPLEPARYNQIVKALEGIGALDNTALKAYLQKRKQAIAVAPVQRKIARAGKLFLVLLTGN